MFRWLLARGSGVHVGRVQIVCVFSGTAASINGAHWWPGIWVGSELRVVLPISSSVLVRLGWFASLPLMDKQARIAGGSQCRHDTTLLTGVERAGLSTLTLSVEKALRWPWWPSSAWAGLAGVAHEVAPQVPPDLTASAPGARAAATRMEKKPGPAWQLPRISAESQAHHRRRRMRWRCCSQLSKQPDQIITPPVGRHPALSARGYLSAEMRYSLAMR